MGLDYLPEPAPRPKPVDVCAQAQCPYCKRYGRLGSCESCGAPNVPVQWIDATQYGDTAPRLLAIPEIPLRTVIR